MCRINGSFCITACLNLLCYWDVVAVSDRKWSVPGASHFLSPTSSFWDSWQVRTCNIIKFTSVHCSESDKLVSFRRFMKEVYGRLSACLCCWYYICICIVLYWTTLYSAFAFEAYWKVLHFMINHIAVILYWLLYRAMLNEVAEVVFDS